MRKTFYQYVMTFRPPGSPNSYREFANNIYKDGAFPKHSTSYHEISQYLETNSPALDAISVFDELWERYEIEG
ncbi:YozE family protein [Bacillus tianshenii]|nr:YozE family protein [Bacillus tianshenii]